jgi:hypothetical protein
LLHSNITVTEFYPTTKSRPSQEAKIQPYLRFTYTQDKNSHILQHGLRPVC